MISTRMILLLIIIVIITNNAAVVDLVRDVLRQLAEEGGGPYISICIYIYIYRER